MVGRNEAELRQIIEVECRALPEATELEEVLERVAAAVARAITKNNEATEVQLGQLIRRGIMRNSHTIADSIREMVSPVR